jgi:phosphate starvation-inducible protein PhoH and related proteins
LRTRIPIRGDQLRHLSQIQDSQYRILKDTFNVRLQARRGKISVQGEDGDVEKVQKSLQSVLEAMDKGKVYSDETFRRVCDFYAAQDTEKKLETRESAGRPSKVSVPMVDHLSEGQRRYIETMRANVVTFSIGPAGSGKTFLAVGLAVQHLLAGQVERIVLVRPAVEAGEKLGFLPGDLNEKIAPYLFPLMDALRYFLGATRADQLTEKGVIEVAPLAYMRGRTLSDSFIILDEAQNTTVEQMKMFLTRIGQASRAVVTGDDSQIDLEKGQTSGLVHAKKALQQVPQVAFVNLDEGDIVRHPVVGSIIKAYRAFEENGS